MPVQLSQIYPAGTVHPIAEMDTRAERGLVANMCENMEPECFF